MQHSHTFCAHGRPFGIWVPNLDQMVAHGHKMSGSAMQQEKVSKPKVLWQGRRLVPLSRYEYKHEGATIETEYMSIY